MFRKPHVERCIASERHYSSSPNCTIAGYLELKRPIRSNGWQKGWGPIVLVAPVITTSVHPGAVPFEIMLQAADPPFTPGGPLHEPLKGTV